MENLVLKHIDVKEAQEIITKTGLQCDAPQKLAGDLNTWVEIIDTAQKNRNSEEKLSKPDIKKLSKRYQKEMEEQVDGLLTALSLKELYQEDLIKKGYSEDAIKECMIITGTLTQIIKDKTGRIINETEALLLDKTGTRRTEYKTMYLYEALPNVYEHNFNRKFGISRSEYTGEIFGPGVQFIMAVCDFQRIEITKYSIEKGYRRRRKARG